MIEMIAIIDFQMGNLRSVQKGLKKLGFEAIITDKIEMIKRAQGLILPGVGAFKDAIATLKEKKIDLIIKEAAAEKKKVLGICLGMQLFFSFSEEEGIHQGLDLIKGRVVKFPSTVKIPQIGWNEIKIKKKSPLLKNIPDSSRFYFVHSYYVRPEEEEIEISMTEYGVNFASTIAKDNIYGVQFHPEKSSQIGLKILKNFGELTYQ